MKGLLAIPGSALIGLMLVTGADAANPEPVTVGMDFVDPITITENGSLRFGLLDQALNTETIIIAPNSGVSGTGTGLILGGTQAAADLTVTATASQSITILVDTIVSGAGYTLGTFMCKYGSGTDTACDGSGYSATSAASATLLIGATLTGDNTAVAGAADGSFNVTVAYQ
jgi:hypothetical protein